MLGKKGFFRTDVANSFPNARLKLGRGGGSCIEAKLTESRQQLKLYAELESRGYGGWPKKAAAPNPKER